MANKDKKNQGGNQGGGGNQSGRSGMGSDSEWESGDEFAQRAGNMTAEDLDQQIEEEDEMI